MSTTMFNLENIVRKNIFTLQPYASARDEFSGREGVFLDANENPFGTLNRYPDPYQHQLKIQLSKLKSVSPQNIFIGNGSDEAIDLAYRIFCNPGIDKALVFSPSYGMYQVSAAINQVELIQLPLNHHFQIDFNTLNNYIDKEEVKLIFICSPNNPTGNTIQHIDQVLKKFKGIVMVDEAYIDFSSSPSYVSKINQYPQLIVLQTFSKAWGLAAARVGMAYASESIIALFNKVKPPYNVSELNQQAAIQALNRIEAFNYNIKIIGEQKNWLVNQLEHLSVVKKIYPSDANFILVEVTDANAIYHSLVHQQIIVRNRNGLIKNCLRITVGTSTQNQQLINALKNE